MGFEVKQIGDVTKMTLDDFLKRNGKKNGNICLGIYPVQGVKYGDIEHPSCRIAPILAKNGENAEAWKIIEAYINEDNAVIDVFWDDTTFGKMLEEADAEVARAYGYLAEALSYQQTCKRLIRQASRLEDNDIDSAKRAVYNHHKISHKNRASMRLYHN